MSLQETLKTQASFHLIFKVNVNLLYLVNAASRFHHFSEMYITKPVFFCFCLKSVNNSHEHMKILG